MPLFQPRQHVRRHQHPALSGLLGRVCKQGLLPGAIPDDDKLLEFAWSNSFDEVIFLLVSAPHIRGKDISVQWEKIEVSINARALRIESRARKIAADSAVTETSRLYHRKLAIQSAFRQCVEHLRDQL